MKKIINTNICLKTDSYKIGHFSAYPYGTQKVYSYFEARKGAKFNETLFFGLQFLLKDLEGIVFTREDVEEAKKKMDCHLGVGKFNYDGWIRLLEKHAGKLPIEIKAVQEGTLVPIDNVLFTVENTDDEFPWLTGHLETELTHVWHPMVVATLSREIKKVIKNYLDITSDNYQNLFFALHDFGARATENSDAGARGGAGHLVNFLGTDTLVAMDEIEQYYNVPYAGLGYSVFATEHSVMTSLGKDGESTVIQSVLDYNPSGIVSVVADSYDYYNFVKECVGKKFKQQIIDRNIKNPNSIFVIRPDSCTPTHNTPEELVLWTFNQLENDFGVTTNKKGFKTLHPAIAVIWGDGINKEGIEKILKILSDNKYDTGKLVVGMGGNLLQKIDRDLQRMAFKCSAQLRDNIWFDIQKNPLDTKKKSKAGKLALIKEDNQFKTIRENELNDRENFLKTVFLNGELVNPITFNVVRKNAELI
jgi:nicotinamide phosphoribosyltransferase